MTRSEMEKENISFHTTSIIGEEANKIKIDSNYVTSIQNKSNLKSDFVTILNASVMMSVLF